MLLDFDRLIKLYKMNVTGVIHIGAHFGEEYDIYSRLDSIKEMVFFEPDPDSFKILEEKIKRDPKTRAFKVALGSEKGQMGFYKSSNKGESSSLLEPLLHLRQYPRIKFQKSGKIEVDLLDHYYFTKIHNLINIDVQGYEMEVFKGGVKTLSHIDYIIAEVNRDEVYKDCCRVLDLDAFLKTHGFRRAETTWDGGTWGDAFYIKDKA